MYHAVNIAVVRSIEEGVASSCSLMIPCPWALHAMQLLRDRHVCIQPPITIAQVDPEMDLSKRGPSVSAVPTPTDLTLTTMDTDANEA